MAVLRAEKAVEGRLTDQKSKRGYGLGPRQHGERVESRAGQGLARTAVSLVESEAPGSFPLATSGRVSSREMT